MDEVTFISELIFFGSLIYQKKLSFITLVTDNMDESF